jgi:hypothetical protein
MLKLASKFAMDIFPSVIATIVGAYIVNHYIRPPAGSPATAAAMSTADPKSAADPKKAGSRTDSKPAERSADLGNTPEPGVRARGLPEKSIIDKSATDKSVIEKPVEKPADKADRPSETASIPPSTPAESRRHQPAPREKAVSKTAPAATPAPAVEPVAAVTAPPAETAATPDANDLARAAIERLRGAEPTSRAAETPRFVAAPATVPPASAPTVASPSLQPLPPPIMVSTPPADSKPAYPTAKRADDPLRPTPPADIPDPAGGAPLDLRAEAATDAAPPKGRPSVADDVLSAAKSMFHSVLPK